MMSTAASIFTITVLFTLFFVTNVESVPHKGSRSLAVAADGARTLTNGERFARGLPPNKPIRRRSPAAIHARASIVPTSSSTEPTSTSEPVLVSAPTANPCPITGVMEVKLANGQSGYWDAATSTEGVATGNIGLTTYPDRLAGVYQFDPCGSNPGNVRCLNCDLHPDFRLAGIMLTSRDNAELVSGSESGYIQLTSSTEPGATPQPMSSAQSSSGKFPTESAVWLYDGATGILAPQWVNPSASMVNLTVSLALESVNNINHFVVQYPTDDAKSGQSGDGSDSNGVYSDVVSLKIVAQQH